MDISKASNSSASSSTRSAATRAPPRSSSSRGARAASSRSSGRTVHGSVASVSADGAQHRPDRLATIRAVHGGWRGRSTRTPPTRSRWPRHAEAGVPMIVLETALAGQVQCHRPGGDRPGGAAPGASRGIEALPRRFRRWRPIVERLKACIAGMTGPEHRCRRRGRPCSRSTRPWPASWPGSRCRPEPRE